MRPVSDTDDPVRSPATQALDTVMVDPRRARSMAQAALSSARSRGDAAEATVAERALGLAARELHDAASAAGHLRRAVGWAHRAGLATAEAEARMSRALVFDELGRPAAALREVDRARTSLQGLRRARADMQRALILRRLGREAEALTGYRDALRTFRRYGDRLWHARALTNRGVLHGYRGETRLARADLLAAQELYQQLRLPTAVAQVQHDLGFVAAQEGDIPTALVWYDRAHDHLRHTGSSAIGLLDRAELLLSARLLPEARKSVEEAIEVCRAGRLGSLLAQARLLSARINLEGRDAAAAGKDVREARRAFVRQGRIVLAAAARRVGVAARVATTGGDRRCLNQLTETARSLCTGGWPVAGWDAWLDAALVAVRLGDLNAAEAALAQAAPARRRAPAAQRSRYWYARAVLDERAGRRTSAKRRAAIAYLEVDAYRASVGATELGVRSTGDGVASAELRLRLALADGQVRDALRWLQRSRSATLHLPPVRPSGDVITDRHLGELRHIAAELQASTKDPARSRRLLRRQRVLEEEVRRRAWRNRPAAPHAPATNPEPAALGTALGTRALVEFFALDDLLHALVLVDGRIRHRPLCPVAVAAAELTALRFAARRVVLGHGSTASRQVAYDNLRHSAIELDTLVMNPLGDLLGDRPLVLAPTGLLHALPWALLPSCRERPVTVTPSSSLWWQAMSRLPRAGPLVLVAGPEPAEAVAEVATLADHLPEATVLAGAQSRVASVLAALDGSGAGHVASHGSFRADNPLFSHLRLLDGPLTVYDLSALRTPPDMLVLSACDSGLSVVHPGDELEGLAAALLRLGTRVVVASLGPVDDGATRSLMVDFHRRVRAGLAPAVALAEAQNALDRAYAVTGASFVCLGAG